MNEGSESSPKVKVVDRRWFTEDGSLREDRVTAPAEGESPSRTQERSEVSERPQQSAPRQREEPPVAAQDAPPSSQVFLELIATLAQQAELLLAGGQGLPPQPDQARRLIDYLVILETKTRGNLSTEEEQVLSAVIFQLRSLYLQRGP